MRTCPRARMVFQLGITLLPALVIVLIMGLPYFVRSLLRRRCRTPAGCRRWVLPPTPDQTEQAQRAR